MELAPDRLVAQSAEGELAPAYLIAGPETLLVLEAADAVRQRARALGIAEREVFDVEGRDIDWAGLQASFDAPSRSAPAASSRYACRPASRARRAPRSSAPSARGRQAM